MIFGLNHPYVAVTARDLARSCVRLGLKEKGSRAVYAGYKHLLFDNDDEAYESRFRKRDDKVRD